MTTPATSTPVNETAAPAAHRAAELDAKLGVVREALVGQSLDAVRLRGSDWFAWATCGGSSVVDSTLERGEAEVLITASEALVLADRIDAERLRDEQVIDGYTLVELPWADGAAREEAIRDRTGGARAVASDRPSQGDLPLPACLAAGRLRLMPPEIDRYRQLGRDAARGLTSTLSAARHEMTEVELGAAVAGEIIRGGMWPMVVLVGGSRRQLAYRHPVPLPGEPIGGRVMVVVCARRHGLVANLTRIVSFREPTAPERSRADAVAQVEAAALDASVPGATLGAVYAAIVAAYARTGHGGAEFDHHQGGITGYRSRDELARPGAPATIGAGTALAWNPSLPGAKIEDTVVLTDTGLEVMTFDPAWPTVAVAGRARPDVLVLD